MLNCHPIFHSQKHTHCHGSIFDVSQEIGAKMRTPSKIFPLVRRSCKVTCTFITHKTSKQSPHQHNPTTKPMKHLTLILTSLLLTKAKSQLREENRVSKYNARKHTWPPTKDEFKPNTEGWYNTITRRLSQIERISDANAKYNAYVNCIHSGLIAPNFTEFGWGLTRAPQVRFISKQNHNYKFLSRS